MKLSKLEHIYPGITGAGVDAAKKQLWAARRLLYRTGGKDYKFPDGSTAYAADTRRRIAELECVIIPALHRADLENRWRYCLTVTGGI